MHTLVGLADTVSTRHQFDVFAQDIQQRHDAAFAVAHLVNRLHCGKRPFVNSRGSLEGPTFGNSNYLKRKANRSLCSLSAAFSAASRVVYVTKAQFDCGTSWMV